MNIPIIIPFLNEAERLSQLIDNLSAQRVQPFTIWIDNASSDSSATIVSNGLSSKKVCGVLLHEPALGQNNAILNGSLFARDTLKAKFVFRLDADSRFHSADACKHIANIEPQLTSSTGFAFGPVPYVDFGKNELVRTIVSNCNLVIDELMRNVGWFAYGSNGILPTTDLISYTTVLPVKRIFGSDMLFSLFQLAHGKKILFSNVQIDTSARRLLKSPELFAHWCLDYEKFIHSKPIQPDDLKCGDFSVFSSPSRLEELMEGRFRKIIGRGLVPLLIFDEQNGLTEKAEKFFRHPIAPLLPSLSQAEKLALVKKLFHAEVKSQWLNSLLTHQITGELVKILRERFPVHRMLT